MRITKGTVQGQREKKKSVSELEARIIDFWSRSLFLAH